MSAHWRTDLSDGGYVHTHQDAASGAWHTTAYGPDGLPIRRYPPVGFREEASDRHDLIVREAERHIERMAEQQARAGDSLD